MVDGMAQSERRTTAPPAWQWIAENFQVIDAETGKARPFIVWPWMVRVLLDTLPEGEDLPYSLLLYSTIKKAGKTAFNAAICAELMFNRAPDGAELYNFANAKEQASGRVYRAVKYAIEHNPALLARCSSAPLETITRLRGGTTLQAMAAMHANIAGANPFYSGWTELWGYEHEKELRAWAEMTPPPTIRNSLRVVDTYAGYEGESGLLNQLEDQLKASPRLHVDGFELPAEYRAYAHQVAAQQPELAEYLLPADDAGSGPVQFDYGLPIYADVESRLYGFWDEGEQARRVPWQRGVRGLGYYAAEARSLLPQQYRRLHLNMRAKRGGQFVGIEVWNALPRVTAWSTGDIDAVVLAVDAATKDDHMALVGVRVRDRRAEECFVKEWLPEADERAGGALVLDPRAVRTEVLRLRDEGMRILAIGFDPYQFHATYLELAADGFNMVEITQGQPRLESDTLLWTLIRDGRIAHTGHGALRVAVENANALAETGKTGDERRLRIVKGSGKVDPLVALSMATWVALNPPKERDASVGVAPGSGLLAGAGSSSGTRDRASGGRLPTRQGGAAQRFKRVQR